MSSLTLPPLRRSYLRENLTLHPVIVQCAIVRATKLCDQSWTSIWLNLIFNIFIYLGGLNSRIIELIYIQWRLVLVLLLSRGLLRKLRRRWCLMYVYSHQIICLSLWLLCTLLIHLSHILHLNYLVLLLID